MSQLFYAHWRWVRKCADYGDHQVRFRSQGRDWGSSRPSVFFLWTFSNSWTPHKSLRNGYTVLVSADVIHVHCASSSDPNLSPHCQQSAGNGPADWHNNAYIALHYDWLNVDCVITTGLDCAVSDTLNMHNIHDKENLNSIVTPPPPPPSPQDLK